MITLSRRNFIKKISLAATLNIVGNIHEGLSYLSPISNKKERPRIYTPEQSANFSKKDNESKTLYIGVGNLGLSTGDALFAKTGINPDDLANPIPVINFNRDFYKFNELLTDTYTPALNRGIWKSLEGKIRDEISQDDTTNKQVHSVYVITGPIFTKNPPDRLESGVAIPDEFYKIISFKKGYLSTLKAVSFIFPQAPETNDFMDYVTTIDEIEKLTGLEFFPDLSVVKQRNLESKKRGLGLEELIDPD